MTGTRRRCIFCGRGGLTLEHVFPQWLVPVLEQLGQTHSATRVTEDPDHTHNVWNTTAVDFKARKVCGQCNSGWLSEIEVATMPVLTPLVQSDAAYTFTREDAATLATWITKTALTASLVHPDESNPIPKKYFTDLYEGRRPFADSVVWIAGYDLGGYPVSNSMIPLGQANGFLVTGNVGHLVYQLTGADDLEMGVVLPPEGLVAYLTQIWPLEPRADTAELIQKVWPALGHLGRLETALNDAGLRYLSKVDDHSWGVEGYGMG
jgi:hypothetical protein